MTVAQILPMMGFKKSEWVDLPVRLLSKQAMRMSLHDTNYLAHFFDVDHPDFVSKLISTHETKKK